MRAIATFVVSAALLMCACGGAPERLPVGYYRARGGDYQVVHLLDHGGYTLIAKPGISLITHSGTHAVDGATLRLHPRTPDTLPAQSYLMSRRGEAWVLTPSENNIFPFTRELDSGPE